MNSIELRGPLPRPFCSQDKFELNKDHLHLLNDLGEGAFGKVIKAAYAFSTPSGTFLKKTVAVKTLKGRSIVFVFFFLVKGQRESKFK